MKDYKLNRTAFTPAFCEDVYAVIRQIPPGKVCTYGDIAALVGYPQYARMVGRALRDVPPALCLPCHRVVNAQGRPAPGWTEQANLLQAEGVVFRPGGNVDLKKHRFNF